MTEVARELAPVLTWLRTSLWGPSGRSAPELVVVDVPALGPRGRGGAAATRIVAVSLAEALDHVLCQVFHEEMHPITDPVVLAAHGGAPDPAEGSAGRGLHELVERTAVDATAAFLAARAPALLKDFHRWRSRFVPADPA